MIVEQSIDEVEIARTATSSTYRESAGELCFSAGRASRFLLVAAMDPFNLALTTDRVGDTVEAVANDAVNTLHAGRCQGFGELVCDVLHSVTLSSNAIGF